jgi:hypothetical protein
MMGVVIRPASFTASARFPQIVAHRPRRLIDGHLAALAVAGIGLAWILAIAGTAFAVRAIIVLCFAALAGRHRRIGAPTPIF